MRSIAIINQKGGVGKTTSTTNLAAAFAARGKRVLAIDLDPQAHLTINLGLDVTGDNAGIYAVLTDSASIIDAAVQARENLWLVPSHIDLAAAESELVSVVGREVILRDALAAASDGFDLVLIDCPPSLGVLTINALAAVTEVFIPLQPHFLALQGLGKLLDQTIRLVAKRINPQLKVTGIMLTMYEGGTRLAGEVVDDVKGFFAASRNTDCPWSDARVFETVIRRNIKLAESPSHGATIFDYAPKSNGALDYARLAAEILGDFQATDSPDAPTVTAPAAGSGQASASTSAPPGADSVTDASRSVQPPTQAEPSAEHHPSTAMNHDSIGREHACVSPRSEPPALIGRPFGDFGPDSEVPADPTPLVADVGPSAEQTSDGEPPSPANPDSVRADHVSGPPCSHGPALIGRPYGDFGQDRDVSSVDQPSPTPSALHVRIADLDGGNDSPDSPDSPDPSESQRTPGPPLAHGDSSEDIANIA